MTLGVEFRSQSQDLLVCLRFLPCPLLSRPLPAMMRALASRVAAGPGLREDEDWLADLGRESLPESLLADGTIAAGDRRGACAQAGTGTERRGHGPVPGHRRAVPALRLRRRLALVFNVPGLPVRPGTPVPTGPAYSKARARSGEAPARAMFGADAARSDIPAGPDGAAFGLELAEIDGATLELFNDPRSRRSSGFPLLRETAAAARRAAALRHPPVEGRRHRPLP